MNLEKNQILLVFPDEETADYVRLICRRKGIGLEGYIIDNFEWDDQPYCISPEVSEITSRDCKGCDHKDHCPDVVRPKKKSGRS